MPGNPAFKSHDDSRSVFCILPASTDNTHLVITGADVGEGSEPPSRGELVARKVRNASISRVSGTHPAVVNTLKVGHAQSFLHPPSNSEIQSIEQLRKRVTMLGSGKETDVVA